MIMHLCACELFLNDKIIRVRQADVEWRAVLLLELKRH